MREDFAGESGIETSDHANPKSKKNEPRLDWGQWDHKPNTAPYTNWYRLQYTKNHTHTSENNLRKPSRGKQNFPKLLEFVHSWDHHFCFPLESQNLK